MGIILDTSILIAAEKQRFDLPALFAAHGDESFYIAAITASELLHGVERANTLDRKQSRARYVEWILTQIETVEFDLALAREHAGIWAALEEVGNVIGPYDLLIAATARHYDYALGTLNAGEFRRISGLRLLDVTAFARI